HNMKGLYFTLEIKGKNITPADSQNQIFLKVDERVIQFQEAPISEFSKESGLGDRAILEKHRNWERGYLSDMLKTNLKVASEMLTLSSGRVALLWQFSVPEGMNQQVKEQIYLTAVSGDFVLLLNCGVEVGDSIDAAKKYLIETMSTLKVSDKPLDVKAIQEAIRKSQ
ncbi:MAG TPA: hypothetical protein VID27_00470, partial [Blastocatellia bacterium]